MFSSRTRWPQIAEPRLTSIEDFRNPRPADKAFDIVRKKSNNHRKKVPLDIIDLVSFEVLSDHGETTEDVVVDESSDESTRTMPSLPLVSWFKETEISRYGEMRCRKFRKHGNGNDCRDGEESSFIDCWDWRHEQSDIFQRADSWAQNEPKFVSSAKGCFSVNFPICSACQKLGVHNQHLPITAHQYDIRSEGECRRSTD